MKKKFLLGLSTLAFIAMGLVPLNATLQATPPPPSTPTLRPKGPEYQGLSQLDGPMATSTPSSPTIGEGTLPQQPPTQENEQNFSIPTRAGHAPGEGWGTYTDANFGFSFSYPTDWEVDVPAKMASATLPDQGYLVTIRNFNNTVAKRDLNPQEIKIDLWLFPKPEKYSSLEEWVTNRPLFAPGTSYSGIERTIMGGKDTVTWMATGPMVTEGSRLIAMEKQNQIILFVAYPASSSYLLTFEAIVQSLK